MRGVRIGRVRGVDIVADASVLVLAALLGWALFIHVTITFPEADSGWSGVVSAGAAAAFIASVVVHELSHSLVALRRGLTVRRVRLFVFGGYSIIEADGLDPDNELLVAVAGPVASLAAAGIVWLFAAIGIDPVLDRALRAVALLNVAIGLFNLLPGFPLDGGRVVRALLWRSGRDRLDATNRAARWGRVLGLGVIGVGAFVVLRFGDWTGFVWAAIGWFLYRSAVTSGRREALLARIDGLTVRDVMREVHEAVPGSLTVARVQELYQVGARLRSMPVEVDGRVAGLLGEPEIERMSPGRRVAARASGAMTRLERDDVVEAATPLDVFFARSAGATGRAVAVADGREIGRAHV